MRNCPACGKQFPQTAVFCDVCGTTLQNQQPATKICGKCNSAVRAEMIFCDKCGARVDTPAPPPPPPYQKQSSKGKWIAGICVLVVVIGVVAGIIYAIEESNSRSRYSYQPSYTPTPTRTPTPTPTPPPVHPLIRTVRSGVPDAHPGITIGDAFDLTFIDLGTWAHSTNASGSDIVEFTGDGLTYDGVPVTTRIRFGNFVVNGDTTSFNVINVSFNGILQTDEMRDVVYNFIFEDLGY